MISMDNYRELEKRYGDVSSWAIWKRPGDTPKSFTDDMSVFDSPDLLKTINTGYVFVGLNASNTHGERKDGICRSWLNFHSGYSRQNDYKLRFALMDTPYWGSYITDVIKKYPEVDSSKVSTYLKKNPAVVAENIKDFEEEIRLLGGNPVIVAMGDKAYKILRENLAHKYKILLIKHYSFTIGKEDYRKEVLNILNS